MNRTMLRCAILLLGAGLMVPAVPQRGGQPPEETRLPNGKLQSDEILKAEYEANLKDAAELADLATQLKLDLEKNDRFVLSMATLKKTNDIEKLAKRIRSRLRHN
ncbi:MAG: hypothetical protein JST11_12735 [Acidobacteria bacterium]|nr:hypothetical protein [Acidobacteriota bacterium]